MNSGADSRRNRSAPGDDGKDVAAFGIVSRGAGGGAARRVKGWDGARAWRFIRTDADYRKAWQAGAGAAGRGPRCEDAPFPVRIRSGADRAAEAGWACWPGAGYEAGDNGSCNDA